MIPPKMKGKLVSIKSGSYTVTETVAVLEQPDGTRVELPMMQKWPVRVGRPYRRKFPPSVPLQSGQRIVDTHLIFSRFDADGKGRYRCDPGTVRFR